jgi:hypothetical protein
MLPIERGSRRKAPYRQCRFSIVDVRELTGSPVRQFVEGEGRTRSGINREGSHKIPILGEFDDFARPSRRIGNSCGLCGICIGGYQVAISCQIKPKGPHRWVESEKTTVPVPRSLVVLPAPCNAKISLSSSDAT